MAEATNTDSMIEMAIKRIERGRTEMWGQREKAEDHFKIALELLRSATESGEKYRHVKRGTVYEVIGRASLQDATGLAGDGAVLVLYRGGDGQVWARHAVEFHDGRFEKEPTP